MAVIFYLSSQPEPLPELTAAVWDKALHFVEYAGLAVLLGRAFRGEGMAFRHAFLAAVGVASLYAASDEAHQIWVPGRSPAVTDWLAGSLGAIGGAIGGARLYVGCQVRWPSLPGRSRRRQG